MIKIRAANGQTFCQYVNPFIGTTENGHTFPGATVPFGLVQLSPETNYYGWDYCSGYHYKDTTIRGFAHTHLNGTGIMDLGDILVFPFADDWSGRTYPATYLKKTEKASPGYYTVTLNSNSEIKAELTAAPHCGVHRYIFSEGISSANILFDLQNGLVGSKAQLKSHIIESEIHVGNQEISGYIRAKQWVDRKYFFFAKFNHAFKRVTYLDSSKRRIVLNFAHQKVIELQVAISSVSIDGAKNNLKEVKSKTFEQVRKDAESNWEKYLSKIQVTGNLNQKVNFYTSLYHLFIQPNNIADLDGKYRGADGEVHQSSSKFYYSTLSLWDTYRATHPLYTILCPEKDGQMVSSMLQHFESSGTLPVWALWGKENWCMIGNHAVPVIVDAYLKGIKGFNKELAFKAIKETLINGKNKKYNWPMYAKYGYLPSDSIKDEAVSRTLEACFDDWCAAQMSKALHKEKAYVYFKERSENYKNIFDPGSTFMRGRYSNGKWRNPFDPLNITHSGSGGDYTEGNAWQYTWSVQHDIPELVKLMGGKKAFAAKLDSLFYILPSHVYGSGTTVDVTGLIGQYAHGNEPSHHIAYLYNYAGMPWKTQELIPKILSSQYKNSPDGLSGNDDCGQMSAWYIFSSLGFYPVNPASGNFDIGVPSFSSAIIKAGNHLFKINTHNLSSQNKYIQFVKLNGKIVNASQITYEDIMRGGNLDFFMGANIKN